MNDRELSQEVIDEFVVAAHHDLPKVQAMLAENPALLNQNATWLETPIQAASHVANRPIAEYLLQQGAPLDICGAAMLGLRDEVAAFLDSDPDLIHATGAHEIPLLFHAAISGNLELVQMLVARGADIDAGAEKQTALHGAAGFGHVEIVRYLLAQGADFNVVDHDGRTPLDVAEQTGHEQVVALIHDFIDNAAV